MAETEVRGLKTVERALSALEFVARAPLPPSVRDVASSIGHNVSSTYNIVNTLVGMGYLVKSPTGELRIGSSVTLLSAALERGDVYTRLLRPYVDQLRDATGETVYLTGLTDESVVVQAVAEGRGSLRVAGLAVGYSGEEDRRASGKAVMAYLPETSVRAIVKRNHSGGGGDVVQRHLDALLPELERIRRQGYAFDDEEFEAGICCVAAPVFDATGEVRASVAVSAPVTRVEALQGSVRDQLVATTSEMSRSLGAPDSVASAADADGQVRMNG